MLKWLFGLLKHQYYIKPKVIEADNELYDQKPEVKQFLEEKMHLLIEPLVPYT
jgi:hypothetical protein